MYKARLSQWGISKNYSDKDYQICSVLNHYRQKSGKRSTAFMIHGHKRSLKDLHKYVKGRKMTEDDFLASALANVDCKSEDQQPVQYAHVRAYTPEPEVEADDLPPSSALVRPEIIANISPTRLSPMGTAIKSTSTHPVVSGPTSGSTASTSVVTSASRTHQDFPTLQKRSTRTKASPSVPLTLATQVIPSAQQRYTGRPSPKENTATWPSNSPLSSRAHLVSSPQGTPSSHTYSVANEPLWNVEDSVRHVGTFYDRSSAVPCQRLGRDVEFMALQMVDSPSLRSLCGHNDIRTWSLMMTDSSSSEDAMDYDQICPTCHESTSEHFISLPNLEMPQQPRNILNVDHDLPESTMSLPASSRGHDHSWRWVARCFAACIYLRRGNYTYSRQSLADADAEFETMLIPQQDPKVLLALNQTLQILQMHDQGELTKTIMDSAYHVAERVLGPQDPLTTIVRWMVYVANGQMRDRDITSTTLRHVHERFVQRHGYEDPRSIASRYCYGFMLNVEWQLQQAEQVLREVYDVSSRVLGPRHLQSISALTNLHRSLQRQDRIDEATAVLNHAVHDSKDTLGENHPRRLESIRLLALLYKQQGNLNLTERLYWQVLEGRIKMLGKNHRYTQGMKVDLEDLLRDMGKWSVKRKVYRKDPGEVMRVFDEVEEATDAQLRLHDLFDWDPHEQWDVARSDDEDSDGTGSQHAAF